jgi:hypothetical protein
MSQIYRPPRPVTGIALLLFYSLAISVEDIHKNSEVHQHKIRYIEGAAQQ